MIRSNSCPISTVKALYLVVGDRRVRVPTRSVSSTDQDTIGGDDDEVNRRHCRLESLVITSERASTRVDLYSNMGDRMSIADRMSMVEMVYDEMKGNEKGQNRVFALMPAILRPTRSESKH